MSLTPKPGSPAIGWRYNSLGTLGPTASYLTGLQYWETPPPAGADGTILSERWKTAPGIVEFGGLSPSSTTDSLNDAYTDVLRYHIDMVDGSYFDNWNNYSSAEQATLQNIMEHSGYRISLDSLTLPSVVSPGNNFTVSTNWSNLGSTPAYNPWNIMIELKDSSGNVAWQGKSSLDFQTLLPTNSTGTDIPNTTTDTFTVPSSIPLGTYSVSVKIVDPTGYYNPMNLANSAKQSDGSYLLGQISVGSLAPTPTLSPSGTPITPTPITNSSFLWPNIQGKVGAFFIGLNNNSDVALTAGQGLNQTVLDTVNPGSRLENLYNQYNFKYYDYYVWNQIYGNCQTNHAAGYVCPYYQNSSNLQSALSAIQSHINSNSIATDKAVSGYVILDDFPGIIPQTFFDQVATMIHNANAGSNGMTKSAISRPTICDFGGWLDYKTSVNGAWNHNDNDITKQSTNFYPADCDMVELYPECYNEPANYSHGDWCDWTMQDTTGGNTPKITREYNILQSKGWDITKEPLIANAQSYGYTAAYQSGSGVYIIPPTGIEESTLIKSYCDTGATSVNDFAWDDPAHASNIKSELANDSGMYSGFLSGVNYCKSKWGIAMGPSSSKIANVNSSFNLISMLGKLVQHFTSMFSAHAQTLTPTTIHLISGYSGTNTGGNTIVFGPPSGYSADDVMIAQITTQGTPGITPPDSSWNGIKRTNTASNSLVQELYYHVVKASEPSTYTFTFTSPEQASGGVADYSGVNTSNPVDQVNQGSALNSSNISAASINVNATGERLMFFGGSLSNTSFTLPTGMSQVWQKENTAISSNLADLYTNAGSTGVINESSAVSADNVAQDLLLQPAGSTFTNPTPTSTLSISPTPVSASPTPSCSPLPSGKGTDVITFTVPTGTNSYNVWFRMKVPTSGDSIYSQLTDNSGNAFGCPSQIIDNNTVDGNWHWIPQGQNSLTQGQTYTFTLTGNQDGVKVDEIILSQTCGPTGVGDNCLAAPTPTPTLTPIPSPTAVPSPITTSTPTPVRPTPTSTPLSCKKLSINCYYTNLSTCSYVCGDTKHK